MKIITVAQQPLAGYLDLPPRKLSSFFLLPLLVILLGLFVAACENPSGGDSSNDIPPVTYTVTFQANGGTPAPSDQTVEEGGTVTPPPAMSKEMAAPPAEGLYQAAYSWYANAEFTTPYNLDTPVTGSLTLYAKWTEPSKVDLSGESGNTLEKALNWIKNAPAGAAYTVALDGGNYTLPGTTITKALTLLGIGTNPAEISLDSSVKKPLFSISEGALVLGSKITLKGHSANTAPLVYVNGSSASLAMKTGAAITGNTATDYIGGGVSVYNGGSFTMEGGIISGNTAHGGGVGIRYGGRFTMKGGEISGNTGHTNWEVGYRNGGGVSVVDNGSSFTMEGGKITGNTADERGGGVFVVYSGSSFTMEGGEISNNTAGGHGGGVFVGQSGSSFIMSGSAVISDNTAGTHGGGVSVEGNSSFIMSGSAVISDNTAGTHGGGVWVNGSFTISGGEISGNTANEGGGGVWVDGGSTFTMSGSAVISDNTAGERGGGVRVNNGGIFTMSGSALISGNTAGKGGGGIFVSESGRFTMSGGEISGNTADEGGGVWVDRGGRFTMSGGEILDNTITGNGGGGVHVDGDGDRGGSFIMSGGAVSGNTTANNGGGVWVDESSSFTMSGGKISGNEAGQGGGVYVRNNGSFTMTGSAVISGNTAGNSGGGVWVNGDGNFSKTGGIIYGDTDNIPYPTNGNATDNTAKGVYPGSGNAVYYNKDNGYYRDTTLDAGDNISTKNALPGNSGPEYGVNNWIKK